MNEDRNGTIREKWNINMQARRSSTEALTGVCNLAPRFLAARVKREIGSVQWSSLSLRISLPLLFPTSHVRIAETPGGRWARLVPLA